MRLRLGEATNFAHKAYVFISFLLKRQETGQHEVGMAGVESERAMSTSEFLVVDMPSSSYFGTDPGKVIVKEGTRSNVTTFVHLDTIYFCEEIDRCPNGQ